MIYHLFCYPYKQNSVHPYQQNNSIEELFSLFISTSFPAQSVSTLEIIWFSHQVYIQKNPDNSNTNSKFKLNNQTCSFCPNIFTSFNLKVIKYSKSAFQKL